LKYFALVFALLSTLLTFSQDDYLENFQRKHVGFPDCEDSQDQQGCFDMKVADFIADNISDVDLSFIIQNKKKDTIRVNSSLYFDKNGILDKEDSKIGFFFGKNQRNFESLINVFPEVKPLLDEVGRGVNTYVSGFFVFNLKENKLHPIYDYVPNEVPFSVIENVPVYKGCDPKILDNAGLKKCMSQKIQSLISKKFNIRKTSRGMKSGTVKIFAMFKVGKKGEVRDIKVRAPNKRLEKETRRVLNLIPKLTKPGFQRGKPVIVPYSLPIVFRIK
jgi:hypothetical protein